jgi:hypothetical protein
MPMLNRCTYLELFFLILFYSCIESDKKNSISFAGGGYPYPEIHNPPDSNFYWYPLKKLVKPLDSILVVYGGSYLYKSFDEPNLSLRPQAKPIFRLICGDSPPIILIITESELIIKQGISGGVLPYTEEKKLSDAENHDLNFLRFNYPLKTKNTGHSAWRNKWLDSLVHARPELLEPQYYLSLLEKGKTFASERFIYKTKKIPIAFSTFKKIVDTIEASGYWSHSYQVECNSYPTDASSYILEANTPERYNIVRVDDCETNNSPIALVFQYLINFARVRDKVHIIGTP